MNAMSRWGVSCIVVIGMTVGLCFAALGQAEADFFQQPAQYSQEEKKPEPSTPAPSEDDEGCKC